ncbi:MAG: hypothetical protein WBV85_01630 [Solirubrobacteraceae bacterium]
MGGFCRTLTCPGPFLLFQRGASQAVMQEHFRWTEALNPREWATVIWVVIAVLWMLTRTDIRASLLNVVRTAFGRTIVVPASVMLAYIAAVVFAASRIGLWEVRLVGATLAWIVASALLGFFKVIRIPDERHYFRAALRRSFEIAVLVDAYVNIFVLPFWAELILIPSVTLLGAMVAVAEVSPELAGKEYDTTRSCLKSLMGVLGIALLLYATIHVAADLSGSSGLSHLGKSLILPLWLNLALIPFMFLLAIRVVYETAFVMLGFTGNATKASVLRAKLALILSVGARPRILGAFAAPWPYRLNQAETLTDARRVAKELRAERERLADQRG